MTTPRSTLIAAAVCGAALIVTAFAFRGQRLGDWIESALIVGFLIFLLARAACMAPAGGRS